MAGACPASAVVEFTVREQALMTAVSDSGTSAASHTGMMQATREMTETACPAEQDLPCGLPVIGAATFVGSDRKTRFNEGDRLADLPAGAAEMALALADPAMVLVTLLTASPLTRPLALKALTTGLTLP